MSEKRIYFYSILGYGDNLITLSLLQQAKSVHHRLVIVGSGITQEIMDLIGFDSARFEKILPQHAAFYALRNNRIYRAAKELYVARAWSSKNITANDIIVLERKDHRSGLMLLGTKGSVLSPQRSDNVYRDRSRLIVRVADQNLDLEVMQPKVDRPAKVIINPSSRQAFKDMNEHHLDMLLAITEKNSVDVTLLDLDGRFTSYSRRVKRYIRDKIPLHDLKSLLKEHELYIGPDSFLVHLAYYLNMPFFVFAHDRSQYFMPLGTIEAKASTFIDAGLHENEYLLKSFTGWK